MDQVVIHGNGEVNADKVATVTEAAEAFLAAVRQEDGLIAYDLSWDILNPRRIQLVEHWVSEEAYTVHTQQPHVREWAEMMKGSMAGPLSTVRSRAAAL